MSGVILTACVGAVNIGTGAGTSSTTCQSNPFDLTCGDDFADARDKIITECIYEGSENRAICASAVKAHPCIENPFDDTCETTFVNYYQTARATSVNFCIFGDNASSPRCANAIIAYPCIIEPFADGCEKNIDITNNDQAIYNRFSFCLKADNANNDLCEEANKAANNCIVNPFFDCSLARIFRRHILPARKNRADFCSDSTNLNHNLCSKDIIDCIANPFGEVCNIALLGYNRIRKIEFCGVRDNVNNPSCASILESPTAATWLQSFDTKLSTTPNTPETKNRFVHGTTTGLVSSGIDFSSVRFSHNFGRIYYLNFTQLGNITSDGTNGVAFYRTGFSETGHFDDYTHYYYAGILSGAGVGGSFTQLRARWGGSPEAFNSSYGGEWAGYFKHIINPYENIPFKLMVNFNEGVSSGTIKSSIRTDDSCSVCKHYLINGNFDDKGLITGTVVFGESTNANPTVLLNDSKIPGTLTGIIGGAGALGAFISDKSGPDGYAGGFIARRY